jgi:replication factor A1
LPSNEEIASTIEELARKLDDVPEDEIRRELERYIDHGVPLHQAKQDLQHTLPRDDSPSTTTSTEPVDSLEKTVGEVSVSDENVDLEARVLSVTEREVTARGEEKTIWSGEIGDETGVVAYTSWQDVGLEPGQSVRIENAYVTEWQDEAQVNIGEHASVEPLETPIEVPAQARKGEPEDIADLENGMGSVTAIGRVLSLDSRQVTVRGEQQTLWEGEIADATGRIPYTAWEPVDFETDDVVRIDNGYLRSFRGVPQLNFGDNATVTELDNDEAPSADELTDLNRPKPKTEAYDVRDLAPGESSVQVTGRVLDKSQREITSNGNDRTLWEGEIADATGRIPYTAWEDFDFEAGDVIRVDNAYVQSFRGLPQLNFGDNSTVETVSDSSLPPVDELDRPREATIRELQDAEGAVGVRVEATVVDVREDSGLILRCPECRRVLREGACQMHGEVDGQADLRVKGTLDDATGAFTLLMDRSTTEGLLSKTLEECRDAARSAGGPDVIREEIEEKILMERLTVDGNATHDEYGTQLVARAVAASEPGDVEDEAEQLIERVHAVAEEVSA